MRLLIINDYGISGGGTENRIHLFITELLKQKKVEQVHVVQKYHDLAIQEKWKNESRLFFHAIATHSAYFMITALIKKYHISLVQTHNLLLINPIVIVAAKQQHIPVVCWFHDYWLLCAYRSFIDPFSASRKALCPTIHGRHCQHCLGLRGKIKHALWKHFVQYADGAIAPAPILRDIHEQHHVLLGKWSVITPWIDPFYFDHSNRIPKKKTKNILFVGSLVEFKGAWVAVRALKPIVQAFPDTNLLFVGGEQELGSRYRKDIEQQAIRDGTIQHISFLGKKTKEEIQLLHNQAAVCICPTVCMESFGLTWAEAMASGCPVIASDIGSIPAYIQHKQNGLLFPPRDHTALAAAILELFSNTKLRARIAKNGQAYAQEYFSVSRATTEILALYDSLLSKKTLST